jgi:hypothetical protein
VQHTAFATYAPALTSGNFVHCSRLVLTRTGRGYVLMLHQFGSEYFPLVSGLTSKSRITLTEPTNVAISIGVAKPMCRSTAKYDDSGVTKPPMTAPK